MREGCGYANPNVRNMQRIKKAMSMIAYSMKLNCDELETSTAYHTNEPPYRTNNCTSDNQHAFKLLSFIDYPLHSFTFRMFNARHCF